METRKMTWKLADMLMTALSCVAISAMGGYDEKNTDLEVVNACAKAQFTNLLEQWEKACDFKWDIEEPDTPMQELS